MQSQNFGLWLIYVPSRVNNRRESIQLQYTRQGHSRESNVTSTRANSICSRASHVTFPRVSLTGILKLDTLSSIIYSWYRVAGNFRGSTFWRMTQILCFGEFNFGAQRLTHILLQYKKHILANFILANADDSPNSPKFPPAKITRYTVLLSLFYM